MNSFDKAFLELLEKQFSNLKQTERWVTIERKKYGKSVLLSFSEVSAQDISFKAKRTHLFRVLGQRINIAPWKEKTFFRDFGSKGYKHVNIQRLYVRGQLILTRQTYKVEKQEAR